MDPLNLNQLALSFDYLVFRVREHYQTLYEQVYAQISHKRALVENKLGQLAADMETMLALCDRCDVLEQQLGQLEQLQMFVKDFNQRLDELERR